MGNDPFALRSGILPSFYEVFSANSFQLSWFNRGTKEIEGKKIRSQTAVTFHLLTKSSVHPAIPSKRNEKIEVKWSNSLSSIHPDFGLS
jgi:hypothetical protein